VLEIDPIVLDKPTVAPRTLSRTGGSELRSVIISTRGSFRIDDHKEIDVALRGLLPGSDGPENASDAVMRCELSYL
jgi:hypothetical protein